VSFGAKKGLKYKPVHFFHMPIKEGCCFFVFCPNLYTLFSVLLWAVIAMSMTSKFMRYFLTLSMTSAEKMSLVHFSHHNLPPSFSFPSHFSDTSDVNFAPITCSKSAMTITYSCCSQLTPVIFGYAKFCLIFTATV